MQSIYYYSHAATLMKYTGKEDELDLNTTECYNVTAAVINECGVSNFSNTTFFPSNGMKCFIGSKRCILCVH